MLLGAAAGLSRRADVDLWMALKKAPGATMLADFAGQRYGFRNAAGVSRWGSLADFTFTRGSTAGRYPAVGPYEQVPAHALRIDHDPITRAPLGALLEVNRTNLFTYSEFPNGDADAVSRVFATAVSDIEGGRTGFALNNSAGGSTLYKSVAVTSGTIYTMAADIEMEDGNPPDFGGGVNSSLNTLAVVIGGQGFVPNYVKRIGAKLWRVAGSGAAGAAGQNGVIQYSTNQQRRIKVTGFQLEVGSICTSYIPTLGVTVARAIDNLWLPTFDPAAGFTLAASGVLPTGQNTGDGNVLFQWSPDRNLTPPYLSAYASIIANGTVNIVVAVHNGTSLIINSTVGNAGAKGGPFRFLMSWKPGGLLRTKVNGVQQSVPSVNLALAAGAVQCQIGGRLNGAAAWGGTIGAFALWDNDNLTDAVQQEILAA